MSDPTTRVFPVVGSSLALRSLALLGATVALLAPASDARAEVAEGSCALLMDPNNAPVTDPRVQHLVVEGTHVNVLLPPDYDRRQGRRYPVLFLFHGAFSDEDSFTTQTDLLAFTAGIEDHDQAIVVMPDAGHLPAGRDWVDGTHPQETYVIRTLLPWVDANYRTLADGRYRAVAGFSAGGLDAMVFAARYPELFSAAGSFSGFLDPFDPAGQGIVDEFASLDDQLCGATTDPNGIWGDPTVHPMGWVGHDPRYLAESLANVSVYIASGTGTPCPDQINPDPFLEYAESLAQSMLYNFDQALTDAGVAHVTNVATCGIHEFSNADEGLRQFWPQMLESFERADRIPASFNYRVGEPTGGAWGWEFASSADRVPEFLDVYAASELGVSVAGSGIASVTTAPLFRRHQLVAVIAADAAASPPVVPADDDGRLVFTVNLGPAHTLEEFTDAQISTAAADPNYFETRQVRFLPLDDEGDGVESDDRPSD